LDPVPQHLGGTYRTNTLGAVGDRWTFPAAIDDIFFTSPWVAQAEFGDLFIDGTGGGDSRQIKVNLSYRFGSGDVKAQRQRGTGLDDAKERLGGGQ
jgi:iron complex outermembrane receptor protein